MCACHRELGRWRVGNADLRRQPGPVVGARVQRDRHVHNPRDGAVRGRGRDANRHRGEWRPRDLRPFERPVLPHVVRPLPRPRGVGHGAGEASGESEGLSQRVAGPERAARPAVTGPAHSVRDAAELCREPRLVSRHPSGSTPPARSPAPDEGRGADESGPAVVLPCLQGGQARFRRGGLVLSQPELSAPPRRAALAKDRARAVASLGRRLNQFLESCPRRSPPWRAAAYCRGPCSRFMSRAEAAGSAATRSCTRLSADGTPNPVVRSQPVVVDEPGIPDPYSSSLFSVVTPAPVPNVSGTMSVKSRAGSVYKTGFSQPTCCLPL